MKTDNAPERIRVNFRCFAGLLLACFPAIVHSAEPRPETLKAWDQSIQRIDLRTKTGAGGESAFLWIDQDPQRAERVRRGEVLVVPEAGANGFEAVPHGLIHDWIGAVFIPGVTLAQVFAVVEDYGHYAEFYRPAVIDAALLCGRGDGRNGEEEQFRVRYAQKVLFTSEVLDSDFQMRYTQRDERRWYSIAQSTRLQEFRDHGNPSHSGDAHDEGNRYIWRIHYIASPQRVRRHPHFSQATMPAALRFAGCYLGAQRVRRAPRNGQELLPPHSVLREFLSRYEQRGGGVYLEQESVVLSRSIPISLRWLVEPAVRELSRNLTAASLRRTREAVLSMTHDHGPSENVSARSGG
jgi:hypothetical protein